MQALAIKVLVTVVIGGLLGGAGVYAWNRITLSYQQENEIQQRDDHIADLEEAAERKAATEEANRRASEASNDQIAQAETRAAKRMSAFHARGEGRFERLLQAKPGLVTRRANAATADIMHLAACVAHANRAGACDLPGAVAGDDADPATDPVGVSP